eukprot:1373899-Amorphochlora_amoeboformis.AAC.3
MSRRVVTVFIRGLSFCVRPLSRDAQNGLAHLSKARACDRSGCDGRGWGGDGRGRGYGAGIKAGKDGMEGGNIFRGNDE